MADVRNQLDERLRELERDLEVCVCPGAAELFCVPTCIVECRDPGFRVSRQLAVSLDEILGAASPKSLLDPLCASNTKLTAIAIVGG